MPLLCARPYPASAAGLNVYTGLLYSIPLCAGLRLHRPSAGCWPICADPSIVSGSIEVIAGTDGPGIIMLMLVLVFIVIGDFMDAVPAIIVYMPIVIKLR